MAQGVLSKDERGCDDNIAMRPKVPNEKGCYQGKIGHIPEQ